MIETVVDADLREFCNTVLGACNHVGKLAVLEAGEQIDHIFMIKEATLGFLTENKESPYPWMLAACAIAGALPLCATFFVVGYAEMQF